MTAPARNSNMLTACPIPNTTYRRSCLAARGTNVGQQDLYRVGALREMMMKVVKAIVLASTILAVGGLNAWAQSGTSQRPAGTPAPAGGGISAATHCVDSAGVTRLKSEVQAKGAGSAQTSGTAA